MTEKTLGIYVPSYHRYDCIKTDKSRRRIFISLQVSVRFWRLRMEKLTAFLRSDNGSSTTHRKT